MEVAPCGTIPSLKATREGTIVNRETSIRSKNFSHFIKGKISLSSVETILMILGELEQFESLVRLVKRKRDIEATNNQVSMVLAAPTFKRIRHIETRPSTCLWR